jgi:hypothetical protein
VRKRFFTLLEANALLPRVRPRLERMMQLSAQLRTDADGGATVMPPGTPWMADPVVAAWQFQDSDAGLALAEALQDLLDQERRAMHALGVEVRDLGLGLVEMHSYLEGATEVLLCWTLAEPEITTYRLPSTGYRTRKPIEGHGFVAVRTASDGGSGSVSE